jgi:hypothetical protein
MKNLILSVIVLGTAASAKAIEFTNLKTGGDPIEVNLVQGEINVENKTLSATDGSKRIRLVIRPNGLTFLFNSKSQLIAEYILEGYELSKLSTYVKNTSYSCPLTIEINRETLKIEKASLQCDPLALGSSDSNAG